MQDHGSVSDAAIGRCFASSGDDRAETHYSEMNRKRLSTGPLHQRNVEMVVTENKASSSTDNVDNCVDNTNKCTSDESFTFTDDFSQKQSPSSTSVITKIHNEKLRKLPPAITNTCSNWTSDAENTRSNREIGGEGDDVVWKIIKGILSAWCAIWVLFAIMIIAADVSATKAPSRMSNANIALTVTGEEEQTFLTVSENLVRKCSYSNLDSETGREECQKLCHNHMCCFNEDDFGCSNVPEKMCAAYAGCESLIVSEDDAIIYDIDGVDVFGIGDDPLASNSSDNTEDGDDDPLNEKIPDLSPEMQLISDVITTVCSAENLGTKHGLNECASLCDDGMCCFDRGQIDILNPNMELILQLEGITDRLDTSSMGTCIDETAEGHFCQVHSSCKMLLLLGSHYSEADINIGGGSASEGKYVVVGILFAIIIMLTVYLLVFQRADTVTIQTVRKEINTVRQGNTRREEMIEFV